MTYDADQWYQALLPSRVYTGDQGEGPGNARLAKLDCIVQEYVNERAFKDLLQSTVESESKSAELPLRKQRLSPEEENIIRYAAGYVPHALLRRYQKMESGKAALFC